MGLTQSKKRNTACDEEERLREYGVLIPPAFGVGYESMLPTSTVQRVGGGFGILDTSTRSIPPPGLSFIEYVRRVRLPGERILNDYMTPGMWVLASSSHESAALASCAAPKAGEYFEGMLNVSSSATSVGRMELRAATSGLPVLLSTVNPVKGVTIQGDTTLGGESLCVGCHIDLSEVVGDSTKMKARSQYYRNDPFLERTEAQTAAPKVRVGSWVRAKAPDLVVDGIHGYGAIELPDRGGIAAIQGYVPMGTSSLSPDLTYLLSTDLNSSATHSVVGPPLVVTMQHARSALSINLSQVMTFDRDNLNFFDDRCPKVRNRIGWTVQMEKPLRQATTDEKDTRTLDPNVDFGVAWQLNRVLCLKMKASAMPSSDTRPTLTGAFVFKQWKQPRVTCSLLFGTGSTSLFGFQGIGLELDTGSDATGASDVYGEKLHGAHVSDESVPETKATLPNK